MKPPLAAAFLAAALLVNGLAACQPNRQTSAGTAGDTVSPRPRPEMPMEEPMDRPTVRELLESSAYVGRTVQVTGRCLGYRVPPVAAGAPPRTRSDWQLEDDGVAIYVTGPLPSGCSATEGSPDPVTIRATVAEDTLATLGGQPPRTRRYLAYDGTR